MKNEQAFTLIELLVVVLIIGILAAVALPQYTLAVNKTRFANLRSVGTSLLNGAETYHLANNTWPKNFDELDIDLPADLTPQTVSQSQCGTNNEIYCCVVSQDGYNPAIICGRQDFSFMFDGNLADSRRFCVAKTTDAKAVHLCKSVGKFYMYGVAFTPEGSKTDYSYYQLP